MMSESGKFLSGLSAMGNDEIIKTFIRSLNRRNVRMVGPLKYNVTAVTAFVGLVCESHTYRHKLRSDGLLQVPG